MTSTASPVIAWTAIAAGVLDVRASPTFGAEAEILLLPALPAEAFCLTSIGAALWRRLVEDGPLAPHHVSPAERALLEEMEEHAIVARDPTHRARVHRIDRPTMSSPFHELVHALVAHVADERGIRCVFIKGPTLHRQGLRTREHSGDVDLWCAPDRWDDLADALQAWGWEREPHPWRGAQAHHTITMKPTGWGCEIDVHRRMPGLTLDDADAFALLMRNAVAVRFAGAEVLVPRADAHAVLAALHAVRPEIGRPRPAGAHAVAVDLLTRATGSIAAAREMGAVPALLDELREIDPGTDFSQDAGGTPRDWEWRRQPTRARAYWIALRDEPPLVLLRCAVRSLWAPDDVALASARRRGEPTTSVVRARYRRVKRGISDLARTVRSPAGTEADGTRR
ncbi:nucleotidyltransferase family protein [Microbacterium sp. NPDC089188]|uniref:nucleotidyltransferase family protein n=1 Tax=Microbacterium sp. NPDC089188 TaxID=3154971 RepID=UPI0034281CD3